MKTQPLLKAFVHAFNGIFHFIAHDRNGKIHFVAVSVVTFAGLYCKISAMEWCILLLCFALVISLEMCNHSLEKVCDALHPNQHPMIKTAKDVAAAAVLWSAMMSIAIGLLIFVPKVISLL
jgi:diacylglycerol kinase